MMVCRASLGSDTARLTLFVPRAADGISRRITGHRRRGRYCALLGPHGRKVGRRRAGPRNVRGLEAPADQNGTGAREEGKNLPALSLSPTRDSEAATYTSVCSLYSNRIVGTSILRRPRHADKGCPALQKPRRPRRLPALLLSARCRSNSTTTTWRLTFSSTFKRLHAQSTPISA